MRNIPVDVSALTFVCVSPPRPKLVNQETGEVKTDRNGCSYGCQAASSRSFVVMIW
ncbi:hypothetical protein [Actinomadura madurae]|uniref:hypothetical protein n=1 Tax=Actinomadura madurae TaxID=1993 RepID=UPI0020D20B5E|nr:hypothetical protein [Actinomadura madurae]MCQ0018382.1 hypothetical protein [Actinomadura madurae]